MPRRASSVVSLGGTSQPGSERKKRARDLLRKHYGLAEKAGDPMDIDSPSTFNPEVYFSSISTTSSLPALLDRENELLTEIRELDGERQSLVYNHHHELIEASDTIRKMKSRAEALDASLDSLKASFQSISQLSASLAPSGSAGPTAIANSRPIPSAPPASAQPPSTPTRRRLSALPEDPPTPTPASHQEPSRPDATFDPLIHLPALLSLPTLLRAMGPTERSTTWGNWEPALRSWEEAEVEGAREVGMECREVLSRRRSASVISSGGGAGR